MNGAPEPAPLELNNEQRKELNAALLEAFPTRTALERMVSFELNENLVAIAGDGPLADVVFRLVAWAEAQGNLGRLVDAARKTNVGNPRLQRFEAAILRARHQRPEDSNLRRLADAMKLSPGPAAPAQQIEEIVRASPKFENATAWRDAQSRGELAVCRIEGGQGGTRFLATGVLIGPDLVLTACYVVDPLIQKQIAPTEVRIRFDYRESDDGRMLSPGREYSLAADWLVDSSPQAALDYAVLRLRGTPGHDPIGGQKGAPPRCWLTPAPAHVFKPGELLFVIQHPQGAPLKLARGTLNQAVEAGQRLDNGTAGPRILYDVPTEPGSGGAPVFASDWELIGIHEGVVSSGSDRKVGVPMSAIASQLREKGIELRDYVAAPAPVEWTTRRVLIGAASLLAVVLLAVFIYSKMKPPHTTTLSGFIMYLNSNSGVPGAVVKVPADNRTSDPTNTDGFFKLGEVPAETQELIVLFDKNLYRFPIEKPMGSFYRVVPAVGERDPKPSAEQVAAARTAIRERSGVPEGMHVPATANSPTLGTAAARPRSPTLWPLGTTIHVAFLDGTPELQEFVKKTAARWESFANVHFDFTAAARTSDVRVSFKEPMAYSYVGTAALGLPKKEATVMLGTIAAPGAVEREAAVLHEFGHVLGLVHEYQTPGAAQILNWNVVYQKAAQPPMNWDRATVDNNLRPPANLPDAYRTKPFDPESVMLAMLPPDWLQRPPTSKPGNDLSAGDRAFIATLYPRTN